MTMLSSGVTGIPYILSAFGCPLLSLRQSMKIPNPAARTATATIETTVPFSRM